MGFPPRRPLELARPPLIPPWDSLLDRGIAYLAQHDVLAKVRAAALIGSVAEAKAEPGSDLDMVLVAEGKIPWNLTGDLLEWSPRFQVVDLEPGELAKHFDRNTIMAWSIRRGIILADPDGILQEQLARPAALPSREWLQELWQHIWHDYLFGLELWRRARQEHRQFCTSECWGHNAIFLARAAINFSLIWACLHSQVPTTKPALREALRQLAVPSHILAGWEVAVRIRREDEDTSPDQIAAIGAAASWFSRSLIRTFSRPSYRGQ
ncbi:MAG: hypothetical protein HPY52_09820 [Firmicutes bacterium]|nr:hypothetical protein [Bacillota bacterium]